MSGLQLTEAAFRDEMVLEAAMNGQADAIVTNNVRDFAVAAKRFQIQVMSPAELLRKVRK